jgi:hypothetical protein
MTCLRFDLWKNFSPYVDGELDAKTIKRVEDHLLDCNACRARLSRLRDGHRFAVQVPRQLPQGDAWEAIAAALDQDASQPIVAPTKRKKSVTWRGLMTSPVFASLILGMAFMVLGLALLLNQPKLGETQIVNAARPFDGRSFRPVSISDIQNNTKTHVVAEGYVTEVRLDAEDGDLLFKLVEDIKQPQPFIICEIISPINLAPPVVGSRVKVYGVSRYDADEGRQWHEVHPVLNIEIVKN